MLRFYNSRSKKIEEFTHDKNIPVNIYTCGPTVYDRVHLGNLKTFMWSDFIVNYLNLIGYSTNHIMNITDIDDKIISRLPQQTYESLIEYTDLYTTAFLKDMENLGVRHYHKLNIHKVTDNLVQIETMILNLLENNYAYRTHDGSIYFDSSKIINNPFIPTIDTSNYESTREIIRPIDIKNNRDFVLWKVKNDEEIKFGENLVKGRCGWHIECSAIAAKHLDKVNIKIGGCDLQFPHHASEIAQSEAYNPNQIYGDYWIHMEFLNLGGDKMSKSLGNVIRLNQVTENYKLLRLYLLSKSYRKTFDYDANEMAILKKSFVNLHLLYNKLYIFNNFQMFQNETTDSFGPSVTYQKILNILSNDFDTASSFKFLFEYIDKMMKIKLTRELAKEINLELDLINNLFNILDKDLLQLDVEVIALLKLRDNLRKEKNFKESDEIRKQIQEKYIFEDDNTGYTLIKKF